MLHHIVAEHHHLFILPPHDFIAVSGQLVPLGQQTGLRPASDLPAYFALTVPAISLAGLVAVLVCGVLEWKQNWFYRYFCLLTGSVPAAKARAAGTAVWKLSATSALS